VVSDPSPCGAREHPWQIGSALAGVPHLFDVQPGRLGGEPLAHSGHLALGRQVLPSGRTIGPASAASTDRHAAVGLRRMVVVELATREGLAFWKHMPPIDRSTVSGAAAISGEAEGRPTGAAPFQFTPYA